MDALLRAVPRNPKVFGRDLLLATVLPAAPASPRRPGPVLKPEPEAGQQRRRVRAYLDGHVSFFGKVAHYDIRELIDSPVTEAVRAEMKRRHLGDLVETDFEADLVERAKAVMFDSDCRTFEEAARLVVRLALDRREHEDARQQLRGGEWEE